MSWGSKFGLTLFFVLWTLSIGVLLGWGTLRRENVKLQKANTELKEQIKHYELFYAVVSCESSWRPHLKSRQGDLGLAQINPRWHERRAKALGFNIRTPGGNIDYAFYLMGEEGTEPWTASQHCWEPKLKGG